MSGHALPPGQRPGRSREEMLQEWREQRAARMTGVPASKSASGLADSQAEPGKENHVAQQQQQQKPRVAAALHPRPPAQLSDPAPARDVGSLAARLECLKRESLRPSIAGPGGPGGAQGPTWEPAGALDTGALRRAAAQLFGDDEWRDLYERGMNAQLTRSRDGATEATKIKELAGMVKLLRRALRELQSRAQTFVEAAVRHEREAEQQVEAAKLSGESGAAVAVAGLAAERRAAAAAAATHKNAAAAWKAELDREQAEAARARRENDRLTAELARVGGEARRAESARAAADEALVEARRGAAVAAREAAARVGQLDRDLIRAREDAVREKETAARVLAAAQEATRAVAGERDALRGQLDTELDRVAQRDAAVQSLEKDLEVAHATRTTAQTQLAELRVTHERVVADAAAVLAELQDWQVKAGTLSEELAGAREELAGCKHDAQRDAAQAATERMHAETRRAELEEAVRTEQARAAAAQAAADHAADQAAIERRAKEDAEHATARAREDANAAESALQTTVSKLDAALVETERLGTELAAAKAQVGSLETAVAAAQDAADHATAAGREAAEKLARLEGELEALQECTAGLGTGDQAEMLNRLVGRAGSLEAALAASEAQRRALHNELVELRGNIRVFCRVRPSMRSVVTPLADGCGLRLTAEGRDHAFSFDAVFGPQATQAAVYARVSELVQSALDGYKVCLFSYGQTGAGKTHTMQGSSPHGDGAGLVPRAVRQLLDSAGRAAAQGWEYSLEAAYVEVYNEALRDLLADPAAPRRPGEVLGRLPDANAIQHRPNGGHTHVAGASRVAINDEAGVATLLQRAAANRAVESTAMNAASSRSHSVFMLYITGRHEARGEVLQGGLSLVDLAGSERLARSGAEGARARETCAINKSLSALGDVFQALAAKSGHVPYRNSKLTHLLQPCLGGSGKTLMFVNINPEPESAGETLCSLRFAAKVNAVETAAKGGAARHVGALGPPVEVTGRPSLVPGDAGEAQTKRRLATTAAGGPGPGRMVRSRTHT